MQQVLQLLQGTIQADPAIRNASEIQLKSMQNVPGFLSSLLSISQSNDSQIAQAATIYFKNRVRSGWDSSKEQGLLEQEKKWVKENILQAIASSSQNQKSLFLASISIMISNEFYDGTWPELVHQVSALIHSDTQSMVMTGLVVLLEIVKYYQWTPSNRRQNLNTIIDSIFPKLVVLATEAEKSSGNLDALFMLKTILKTYNYSIRMELIPSLQRMDSIAAWGTIFLTVIQRKWNREVIELPTDSADREKHVYWKCKKWAFGCMNSLMGRYARARKKDKNYAAFSKLFLEQFVPRTLDVYLIQISNIINGDWASKRVQQSLLTFLEHCVKPKHTWNVVKTHLEPIIGKFIFPLLSYSEEDEELWNEDPVEYIHKKVDPPMDDFKSPVTAAHELLVVIAENRFSEAFVPIMTMINGILTTVQDNPRMKFGALNMMCYLADLTLSENSPIKSQMEHFMVTFVFQDLRSPYAFLRAKACDVITRFAKLIYVEEKNLQFAFSNILGLVSDGELPVRVSASLAIASFLKYPVVIQALKPHVVQLMQGLMNITNEIDLDTLSNSMELLVFEFSEDLKPFATQLATQLRDTFMRIMADANFDSEDFNIEDAEDKTMAAMGVLKTLASLVLAVESSTALILELEIVIMPAVKFILEHAVLDLFEEAFEILGTSLFCAKQVSPTMWSILPLIYQTFKQDGIEYLEEMLPSLDNYIAYGKEMFARDAQLQGMMVDIITTIFNDEHASEADCIRACQLMESLMLNLPGSVDQHIPTFMELAFKSVNLKKIKTPAFRVHVIEIVLNAVYYNAALTISLLERASWTTQFIGYWFRYLSEFKRVHDKKLSILTICTILEMPRDQIPHSVQVIWKDLMGAALTIFATLPAAIEAREAQDDDQDDDDFKYREDYADEYEDEAEEDVTVESLAAHASQFSEVDDDDDEEIWGVADFMEEDICFMTALDPIDPYVRFQSTVTYLNSVDQGLFQSLSQDQRTVLQYCMTKAQSTS